MFLLRGASFTGRVTEIQMSVDFVGKGAAEGKGLLQTTQLMPCLSAIPWAILLNCVCCQSPGETKLLKKEFKTP